MIYLNTIIVINNLAMKLEKIGIRKIETIETTSIFSWLWSFIMRLFGPIFKILPVPPWYNPV
jgi:hypothetical protein